MLEFGHVHPLNSQHPYPAEFSRPVSGLSHDQDGLSQRSISELPRSPSVDEPDHRTDLSTDQELDTEYEQDQDQGLDQLEQDPDSVTTPTKRKDIKVCKDPVHLPQPSTLHTDTLSGLLHTGVSKQAAAYHPNSHLHPAYDSLPTFHLTNLH